MTNAAPEVVQLDDKLNAQIAGGRFVSLVGFDADGKMVHVIPVTTDYKVLDLPGLMEQSAYAAASSGCYCNCTTRTVWCCFGGVCWNTSRSCSC